MTDYPTISKQNPSFPPYLDFQALRRIGIDYLQGLSGKLWTDHNLHDPGITILEVLCYAVTDLGYRNNLDITDLLTLDREDPDKTESNFFTPDEILTCNPVTPLDWRKRLIDIFEVRNAWLEKIDTYEPTIYIDQSQNKLQYTLPRGENPETAPKIHPKGLYRVYLDLEPILETDACDQVEYTVEKIVQEVKSVLCQHRNLCEDFDEIIVLKEEEIALCADIELEVNADPEDVQVDIYVRMQDFLVPRVRFYRLQELLDKGKTPEEIFAGRPASLTKEGEKRDDYDSHGFIDTDELKNLDPPENIYTSDLYRIIANVPGVKAIKKLSISSYIEGVSQSDQEDWCLPLTPGHRPVLGLDQSKVTFFRGYLPFKANKNEVKRRYYQQQAAHIKTSQSPYALNLPIPRGSYLDVADHYSINHDFPLTYGVGDEGVSGAEPALRKAQARQLQGYLIFFDQVLANYLAQLAHVRDLFSYEHKNNNDQNKKHSPRTYFTQPLTTVPRVEDIIRNYSARPRPELDETSDFIDYPSFLEKIREDSFTSQQRRNLFLDHLLARFAESFTDYVLLNYRMNEGRRNPDEIIADKAQFVEEYPTLSRDRFRGFDYCKCDLNSHEVWNTDNVSGFQKRVSRLLGINRDLKLLNNQNKFWRRYLNHYQVQLSINNPFEITIYPSSLDAFPLKAKLTYPNETAAYEALDLFLETALTPSSYKRLSYRYYYYYVLQILDPRGQALVTYAEVFSSLTQVNTHINSLLKYWKTIEDIVTIDPEESVLASDYWQIRVNESSPYHFTLTIPIRVPDSKLNSSLEFTNSVDYEHKTEAIAAAKMALTQMSKANNYRKTLKRNTYYGYGVIDANNHFLAESSDRFTEQNPRNIALAKWSSCLRGNQNSLRVEPDRGNYVFYVDIPQADEQPLRSVKSYSSEAEAWQAVGQLTEHLRYRSRYISPRIDHNCSPPRRYRLGIEDAKGQLLAGSNVQQNVDRVFRQLNPVEPFLRSEAICRISTQKIVGYRFNLVDRNNNVLLVGTQIKRDPETVYRHFYRDVLSILLEEGVIQRTTFDERKSFSYQVISYPGVANKAPLVLATHPPEYPSKTKRDQAIKHLKILVRSAGVITEIREKPATYQGRIDHGNLLLETSDYDSEEEAWKGGDTIMELASTPSIEEHGTSREIIDNFRLIDDEDNSNFFSWELVNQAKNKIIIRSPHHFASTQERIAFLETLQACINEEGFHLVEHILLRPKHHPLQPLCPFPPDEIPLESIRETQEAETRDDYDLTQPSTSGQTGFELFKKGDRYYFHFNDCQGNALFYSEAYTSKAGRNHGVGSVITNSIVQEYYSQKESFLGEERRIYFFTLRAKNGQEIGRSRYFTEKWKLEGCLTWFQQNVHLYAEEFDLKLEVPDELKLSSLESDYFLDLPNISTKFPDLPSNFDPYSFRVSVILPSWPARFQDNNFRTLLERTLQLEAPAHVALNIYWLDVKQMHDFEQVYRQWLEQLHLEACGQPHDNYTPILKDLIKSLSDLKNSYSEGILHDCEISDPNQTPIILNQTKLGGE